MSGNDRINTETGNKNPLTEKHNNQSSDKLSDHKQFYQSGKKMLRKFEHIGVLKSKY